VNFRFTVLFAEGGGGAGEAHALGMLAIAWASLAPGESVNECHYSSERAQ
jgi:hypothetical protein